MNVYATCTEIKQNVHALHLTRVHDSSGIMFTAEKIVKYSLPVSHPTSVYSQCAVSS